MLRIRLRKILKPALGALGLATVLLPAAAVAQDLSALDSGDTGWVLTATVLVLFMTIPGLALFYAGLVRASNTLSVMMQCFTICCLASVVWLVIGYSLAFDNGGELNQWIGGTGKMMLAGVGFDSLTGTIPETVFFMFQMTFAIITPALIVGAYVERIKFGAMFLISVIWLIVVYAPVTHWVWGGGWLAELGVMDFAGGLVVHATAGVSALVIVGVLGPRRGFPGDIRPPHSPGLVMIGAAMLWVGWFGFNAGSALTAGTGAGMAMLVTHISAATASLTWMVVEWLRFGKPTLVGMVTGTIAGLATITPASGFVGPWGGLIIGLSAGAVCFAMVQLIKQKLKIDDALDVFAVHGVGGALGIIMVSFLAAESMGGIGLAGGIGMGEALKIQLIGLGATVVWSGVLTYVIVKLVALTVGLRVSAEDEIEGLDITLHGERSYDL